MPNHIATALDLDLEVSREIDAALLQSMPSRPRFVVEHTIAIGSGALATGTNATALGDKANANADQSTAVGRGAKANAGSAVAVGHAAIASGK